MENGQESSRHFAEQDSQLANRLMKRFSTLSIREAQIKITVKHHYTHIKMSKTKTRTHRVLVRGRAADLTHAGGIGKLLSYSAKRLGGSLDTRCEAAEHLAISLSGIYPKEMETYFS